MNIKGKNLKSPIPKTTENLIIYVPRNVLPEQDLQNKFFAVSPQVLASECVLSNVQRSNSFPSRIFQKKSSKRAFSGNCKSPLSTTKDLTKQVPCKELSNVTSRALKNNPSRKSSISSSSSDKTIFPTNSSTFGSQSIFKKRISSETRTVINSESSDTCTAARKHFYIKNAVEEGVSSEKNNKDFSYQVRIRKLIEKYCNNYCPSMLTIFFNFSGQLSLLSIPFNCITFSNLHCIT